MTRSPRPVERRTAVLDGSLGRAELLSVASLTRTRMPTVHSPEFQVLFPLTGVFNWHIGSDCSLVDANQVLFIAAGDESQDSHPSEGDVEALLLTPEPTLLESAWACDVARLSRERAFATRVLPSSPEVQQLAAVIAICSRSPQQPDTDELEEAVVALLSSTAKHSGSRRGGDGGAGSRALVGAVKEIVSAVDGRVSLARVAEQLGRSPAYLTEVFRRSEGIPIARYQRRLRLARALAELPHTDDITELALRFGFSSHAHFSSAFRAAFGRTPSEYRAGARRRDLASLLGRVHLPPT